jgi:capsular exopolysaccharide synthesis family protein
MASSGGAWPPNADRSASVEPSLRRWGEPLRERWWLVVLAVVICTGAATGYALTGAKVYEAHADVLVTPVPDDQTAVLGLGLIRRASDPTRDVTTAARLIDNTEVATRVAKNLHLHIAPAPLLDKVRVDPVAQSSIVAITASAGSPDMARRLADGFGAAAVALRTEQLHRELDPAIRRMRAQIRETTGSAGSQAPNAATQPLYEQLAALESLRSAPDPTLRVETPAMTPRDPVWPRTKLSIAGGVLVGLLIGAAGALALSVLDPRRDREDRLGALGLSVLTRVPHLSRSARTRHAFDEAFRFLRTMLRFAAPGGGVRTIAVTSTSEKEGKTTTSFQLAMANLEAGHRVLLVEADTYRRGLRRLVEPDGDALSGPGLLEYLSGTATLDEIVQSTAIPSLSFVSAGALTAGSIAGLLERPRGRAFVGDLADYADVTILDCPPVAPRSDAVLIASAADAVILVLDIRQSEGKETAETVSRLRSADANVVGVVLNRDEAASPGYEYAAVTEPRDRWRARTSRRSVPQ